MLMILEEGGHFCIKLFDVFTHLTASMLYIVASIFRDCYVVKPARSRVCNRLAPSIV